MSWLRTCFLLLIVPLAALQAENVQDPATTLARILAEKGQLTQDELARVEAAAAGDRVSVLAAMLQQKGILSAADVARLSAPAATAAGTVEMAQGPSSASPVGIATTSVAPSSANAPSVPQQTMPSQRAEVNSGKHIPLTINGTLLFNAGLDTTGENLADTPTIAAKPGSSPTAADQSFFATVRQTRVGVRLDPVPVGDALLTGNFEIDAFTNAAPFANGFNMNGFRMRLAYGRLDWDNFAIEIGQDWSIFAPLNPTSLIMFASAEFQGAGNPWARIPQVRIEDKIGHMLWQLAAEDNNMGDFNTTFTGTQPPGAGELGRMPALESRMAFSMGAGDRDYVIGFSGRYGHGKNIGTVGNTELSQGVDSWGGAVDYALPFTSFFNLSGEAYSGRALGIYDVAAGESIGTVGTAGGHGVESWGGWSQLQFNFTKKWQANFGYGFDAENAREVAVGTRDRNQNYFGNIIYSFTPNFKLSPEYRRILTDFRNQSYANARSNQVSLNAAYVF